MHALRLLKGMPSIALIALAIILVPPAADARDIPSNASTSTPKQLIVLSYNGDADERHDGFFYRELLELVLQKTLSTHGAYEVRLVPVISNENRLLRAIEQGQVDVTWMPYDKHISMALRPVKVSLLKELSNYRLLFIRAGDQEGFSKVTSLDDLRRLRGGIGAHWPDRQVMRMNELPLTASVSYSNLFKMLVAGRFDYFPRGIYQIPVELKRHGALRLALETDLMLYYENPVYFYVQKDNVALAQRLEQGLKLAMSDGSYDELLERFPNFQWARDEIARGQRLILELETP